MEHGPRPWEAGEVTATEEGLEILRSDGVMAGLVEEFGPYRWSLRPPFYTLCRGIAGQSISGRSASVTFERFAELTEVTPEGVLAASDEALRGAGLPRSKIGYLRNVARFALDGGFDGVAELGDERVEARLVEIKGVGEWTAEMFLIFCLGRRDVWPLGDLGVRSVVEELYGASARGEVREVGERFRPYRSAAVWYVWRESMR